MFKDFKKTINKRNREIEDIKEDQMEFWKLKNTLSEMKIY